MKLIKNLNYQNKIWKNGQGSTAEIAIFPEESSFTEENFLWRFSSANITADNQFSKFIGYDRILIVSEGAGLLLNGFPIEKFKVVRFSGETSVECKLLKDKVIDLGLIFKRDLIQAKMTLQSLPAKITKQDLILTEGTHLLYCAKGSFLVQEYKVENKDTLIVEGPDKLEVQVNEAVTIIHIKICEIKNKPKFCKGSNV